MPFLDVTPPQSLSATLVDQCCFPLARACSENPLAAKDITSQSFTVNHPLWIRHPDSDLASHSAEINCARVG